MSESRQPARGPRVLLSRPVPCLLALALIASTALAQDPPGGERTSRAEAYDQVLILSSFAGDFAHFNDMDAALKTALPQRWRRPLDILDIPLDLARFEDEERQAPYVAYLQALLLTRRPDLVIALGGPASRFALSHHQDLFPRLPILHAGMDERVARQARFGERDGLVPVAYDLTAPVEDLLRLLPKTENLAIVIGSSSTERFWRETIAHDLARYEDRLHLIWLEGLSLSEICERVATLPPRSAVYFALLLFDGAGVPHSQTRALAAIHAAANAPVIGLFASQLGSGIIGGRLTPVSDVGNRIAEAAVRLLAGETPAAVRYPPVETKQVIYDERELRRWGIPRGRLPVGSEVRFERYSPWSRYRWPLVGVLALLGVQTAMIFGLVAQRNRRRAAEQEVRALHGRLLTTYEQERGRLARELHDDVTQRLARLAIDAAHLERSTTEPGDDGISTQLRHELVRLTDDVQALSRRLHPSVLYDLGLAEALRAEAERFSADHALTVAPRLDDAPSRLSPDVALCLYRVAQESLRNVARHAQARRVEISLSGVKAGVELAVRDDGKGFDPEAARTGGGLGLISLRERLHLVGGRLAVVSAPGRGTTILAWAPLAEAGP